MEREVFRSNKQIFLFKMRGQNKPIIHIKVILYVYMYFFLHRIYYSISYDHKHYARFIIFL